MAAPRIGRLGQCLLCIFLLTHLSFALADNKDCRRPAYFRFQGLELMYQWTEEVSLRSIAKKSLEYCGLRWPLRKRLIA